MTKRKSDEGSVTPTARRRIIKPKAKTATAGDKKPAAAPVKRPAAKPAAPVKTEKEPKAAPPTPDYLAMSAEELEELMEPKQILFCLAYLKTFNATQAAKEAKYSPKTAQQIGHENLTKPVIQAYLSKIKEQVFTEAKVDAKGVLQQIARLGFSDVRSLFDENGKLKDVTELGDDIAAAVQSIEIERRTEGKGEDKETYYVHKIRLAEKKGSLEMLARHLQLFTKAEDDEEAAAARKMDTRTKALLSDLITDATSRHSQQSGKKK